MNRDDIKFKLEVTTQTNINFQNTIVLKVLDYDGKKKAEHMCSAVTTLGELRTGGQWDAGCGRGGRHY